ncbi:MULTISPECIES: type VI secretion system membrane subunit TssM [unclassified Pseudomonas]|uniref:type VI secretion system membrane subunit TssM n=1 Tax=unclassified Pseudomonas TaxID=196821 RepID=UPI003810E33D
MSFLIRMSEALGRVLGWLASAWLLALLGVLLAALFIWHGGPLLTFNGHAPLAAEHWRWSAIALLVGVWGVCVGWRAYLAWRAGRLPGSRRCQGQAEVVTLTERMHAARAVLRKRRRGRGLGGQLPGYLLLGAVGSGKTTALAHSGLSFPLNDTPGVAASGAIARTEHCDWWFTDEAVLLDTAGRYATQASDPEKDKAAWLGLLDLLRKHRRRSPLSGVIVTLSVSDVLQQDDTARERLARALRARIEELYTRLGVVLPVYVMVTQCDRLPGFVEFFEHFGQQERAQVWGVTLPLAHAGQPGVALASFPLAFDALERQLQVRVLQRLQQERGLSRRALLYQFPQQFAKLKPALGGFLDSVFEPNRFQVPVLVRGVYFTSGPAKGRSFFISQLLREVIFNEAGLAVAHPKHGQRQWLRIGKVGIAGLAVVLAVGMGMGFQHNLALLDVWAKRTHEVAQLAQASPRTNDLMAALPLLDSVRALAVNPVASGQRVALLEHLGLSQDDPLQAGAMTLYRRLLRTTVQPQIVAHLENVLRRGDASNQVFLFEALRAYLMLGDRQFFDTAVVQAWVDVAWLRELPEANEAQRDALSAHVAALLADRNAEPVQLDAELVAAARRTLARLSLPQRIYSELKRQMAEQDLPAFSLDSAVGREKSQLLSYRSGTPLSRGVSGVYSVAGYRAFVQMHGQVAGEMRRGNWVLGRQEAVSGEALVLALYFADYIREWEAFLNDVQLAPLGTLSQAAGVSSALAGADSPLHALLQSVARETTLEGATAENTTAPLDPDLHDRIEGARKQLERRLDGKFPTSAAQAARNPVDQHFAGLHALFGPATPVPLSERLALFKAAMQFFDGAENARNAGTPAPSGEVLGQLRRAAGELPAPLSTILQGVADSGAALTLGNERERLNALWRASGAPFCRAAIAGRYPLVRDAGDEVTAEDFGRFFGPDGVMDDFFNQHLAPYVDMGVNRWRWRASGNAPRSIPQAVLDQFQRAARLREMFFASGARQPSLRFNLKPLYADPALGTVVLDIAGQAVVYEPDNPHGFTPIVLPSGKGSDLVHLQGGDGLRAEGPWAWLRLIDQGQLSGEQRERFVLAFDLDGRKVRYALQASSVINPFRRDALEPFRCPLQL